MELLKILQIRRVLVGEGAAELMVKMASLLSLVVVAVEEVVLSQQGIKEDLLFMVQVEEAAEGHTALVMAVPAARVIRLWQVEVALVPLALSQAEMALMEIRCVLGQAVAEVLVRAELALVVEMVELMGAEAGAAELAQQGLQAVLAEQAAEEKSEFTAGRTFLAFR